MSTAAQVMLAIANELAAQAKENMPELRKDEILIKEWFCDGVYYRTTKFEGQQSTYLFDFRQKKSQLALVDN